MTPESYLLHRLLDDPTYLAWEVIPDDLAADVKAWRDGATTSPRTCGACKWSIGGVRDCGLPSADYKTRAKPWLIAYSDRLGNISANAPPCPCFEPRDGAP